MDRSERRYRAAHKKARRLRYYHDYWRPRGWISPYTGEFEWLRCGAFEAPWRVDGAWFYSTPSAWTREMMTRPARAETNQLLRLVSRGMDAEVVKRWPDYRKPHVYYW